MFKQADLNNFLDDVEEIWGGDWTYECGWGFFAEGSDHQMFFESYNINLYVDDEMIVMLSQVPIASGMNFTEDYAERVGTFAFTNLMDYLKENRILDIMEKHHPVFLTNVPFRG